MIGAITFILAFLLLGVTFGVFRKSNYLGEPNKYGDSEFKPSGGIRLAIVLIAALVITFINPVSVQRIDAGNVGLKIDKVGNSKGIPVAIPVKGWVFYNSWTTDIVEYSIRQNHVQYEPFDVTTKGGFSIKVAPSFNYALKPEKAADVYINLLKGGSFSSLDDQWIKTATNIAMTNASNGYTIDSIFNNKQHYQQDVNAEINKELAAYFTVSQINPGVVPPAELANVIKQKTEAIQKAQQAELDRVTAEAKAKEKIAIAKGDSAQMVINASGQARANQLLQQSLTPELVQKMWIEKWNGQLPTYQLGSGSGVMLQLPKQ